MEKTETLRDMRRAAGMTQTEVAGRLGISQASYAAWETGIARPTLEKLPPLANALGVGVDILLPALIRTKGGKTDGAA